MTAPQQVYPEISQTARGWGGAVFLNDTHSRAPFFGINQKRKNPAAGTAGLFLFQRERRRF